MTTRTKWLRFLATVSAIVALGACALFEEEQLLVTISANRATASASEPAKLTVTAENQGNFPVSWGRGSGSCQLRAVVRIEGEDWPAYSLRFCTADSKRWHLDPGESRTEGLFWSGKAVLRDSVRSLPPGDYEVRGAAGSLALSAPLSIRVLGSEP